MRVGISITAGCVAAVGMMWAYMTGWDDVYVSLEDAWMPPSAAHEYVIVAHAPGASPAPCTRDDAPLPCASLDTLLAVAQSEPGVVLELGMGALAAGPSGSFVLPSDPSIVRPAVTTARDPGTKNYPTFEGRAPRTDHEVALSNGVAELLDVRIGDTVTLRPNSGQDAEFVLTGLLGGSSVAPPLSPGQTRGIPGPHTVLITAEGFARLLADPDALGFATLTWDGATPASVSTLPHFDPSDVTDGFEPLSHPHYPWWWAAGALAVATASVALAWRRRCAPVAKPWRVAVVLAAPTLAGLAIAAAAVQIHRWFILSGHPGTVTVDWLHPHAVWTTVAACLGLAVSAWAVAREP